METKSPSPRMQAAIQCHENGGGLRIVVCTSYGKDGEARRKIEFRMHDDPNDEWSVFREVTKYQAKRFMSESQAANLDLIESARMSYENEQKAARADRFGLVLDIRKERDARRAEDVAFDTACHAWKEDSGVVVL